MLQDKLEALLAKYNDPLDKPQLQAWERECNRLLLLKSAADNEGVKLLIQQLHNQVAQINEVLLSADSDEISDYQRDRLLDQKKIINRILSYFTDIDKQLEALEAEFDKNI